MDPPRRFQGVVAELAGDGALDGLTLTVAPGERAGQSYGAAVTVRVDQQPGRRGAQDLLQGVFQRPVEVDVMHVGAFHHGAGAFQAWRFPLRRDDREHRPGRRGRDDKRGPRRRLRRWFYEFDGHQRCTFR